MKIKHFLAISSLGLSMSAQAGFLSSYVLGVPTSVSVGSMAGAALSKSKESEAQLVEKDNKTNNVQEKYSIVGLEIKDREAVPLDIENQEDYLKEYGFSTMKIEMKPSEELKLNFLWKSDVFGNVTNRLSPEDLEKNKFANFKSSIDDKFLIKRVDDGVILKNTADSVRYAIIGEKVERNKFFMVLYDYEKRLEKREDEKRGVLLLMALLLGIPSGFMFARIGKTIAREGFTKRDKQKIL